MKNIKMMVLGTATAAFICGGVVCLATKTLADDQAAAQPHWTNRDLAESGYGTPDAALKTLLWSVKSGDGDTFLASFSPDKTAKIQKAWADKLDKNLAVLRRGLAKTTDFELVSELSTNNETTIDLLSTIDDGRNYDRKFTFTNIDNGWKCDRVFPIPHFDGNDKN